MTDEFEGTPLGSEKGKEILAWAMNQDYCVLEFTKMDDGTTRVMPITDHVEMLEDKYVNEIKD